MTPDCDTEILITIPLCVPSLKDDMFGNLRGGAQWPANLINKSKDIFSSYSKKMYLSNFICISAALFVTSEIPFSDTITPIATLL